VDLGLEGLGRYAGPALVVLVSLADGPKHGYAIMEESERLSGARLGPGTLYAVLARLEQRGLIEALPAEARRRPYRLTAAGSTALTAHLSSLRRLATTGLQRLAAT